MRGAISSTQPATMYSGGSGNGSSIQSVMQTACTPLAVESIFYGGAGSGSSIQSVTQTTCTPLAVESIFYGGAGSGSSIQSVEQTTCTPLAVESIFYGGSGNGSSIQSVAQTSCPPLNLIRYYDPGNSSSYDGTGTALYDLSGFSVNGTLVNGVSYNSSNGGALVFDGTNDYLSFSSGLPSTDNLTYEAWVNPSSFSGFNVLLNHDNWATGYVHFQFDQGALHFDLYCCQNGGQNISSTYTFTTNTWYQVVAVYSKSLGQVSLYVNGSLTNTVNLTGSIPTITNTSFKMGSWNGNDRFFNGKIGLIKIYSKTLSSAEILSNYNDSRVRFGL